ncbi:MAG: LytR/AlgR family response regulator transcription factor, partial [Cyclobacteriaceae bacterium]
SVLSKFGVDHVAVHNDLEGASAGLHISQYDAAFIDIQISGKPEGFKFAQYCGERSVPIVFLTSFGDEETIESAIDYGPVAYLNKPFKESEINALVKMLEKRKRDDFVVLLDGKKEIRLKLDDIVYLEANTPYVNIHLKSGNISVRSSIVKLIDKLSDQMRIQRIHKAYAVAESKIESKAPTYIVVNGVKLPFSKKYIDQ